MTRAQRLPHVLLLSAVHRVPCGELLFAALSLFDQLFALFGELAAADEAVGEAAGFGEEVVEFFCREGIFGSGLVSRP